ncbi:stress responsive A/B barrel domain-containing protein [Irpex lacteus]|nr:stress responsive A/B barrel domain-containing protein [Irpex lacteus]
MILVVVLTSKSRALTDWLVDRGAIVHMVMFRYQPTLSQSTKNDVASAFLALKDSCRLPDGSRYIVSLDGGSFTSPEGRGKGLEHAFVVTFRSKSDRDYYLNSDPAHLAFVASILEKVADSTVFDFESGEFERTSRHRRRRPSDELHIRTI